MAEHVMRMGADAVDHFTHAILAKPLSDDQWYDE